MRGASERLLPYVPRLVVDWLRDAPTAAHRRVQGTLAFCDVSGFTALTERLAGAGKVGAEEMGDLLNTVFTELLVDAYAQGAALIKYGGDAVLLLFQGADHEVRACRAAWGMQQVMGRIGSLRTSVGPATLRMSVGVHSGELDFFLVGSKHRELVVTGSAATTTARMEAAASAGEILVSSATAAHVSVSCLGADRDGGRLLVGPPGVSAFETFALGELPDLTIAVPPPVAEHVLGGWTESEHRQVVPGFVEFSGVDALLAEQGPAATAEALTELVDLISESAMRHGVTFLATDIGKDGGKAIVVGGAPRNDGDPEGRVLSCLREVLDQPTVLCTRAGATSGRAFAGDYGPPYRRTYSVVGDAVNLAARLMAAANPGQLLAEGTLVDRSRSGFVVTELPPVAVKGKSEPVVPLAIGAPTERRIGVEESLPFVGRSTELSAVRLAVLAARAGAGRHLEVIGRPGTGKSRLIQEALDRATVAGVDVVELCCDAYASATPYSTARRLVMQVLKLEGEDGLADALRGQVLRLAPALEPWLPMVAALLGISLPSTPEIDALDERFRRARLGAVLLELVSAACAGPTVLLFDDAHLADDGSRSLIRLLGEAAADRPWVVIETARPEPDAAISALTDERDHLERLYLAPLQDDDALRLLTAITDDEPLRPHEIDVVLSRAAGNPLYLRELIAARARLGTAEDLPDSLDALVAAQVDALDAGPRRLLRVAAVLGTEFPLAVLHRVLALSGETHDASAFAELSGLLSVREGQCRFRDSVVRDTAYEGLPYRVRSAVHGHVADVLASAGPDLDDETLAMLAWHYAAAGRQREALEWSERAALRAAERFARYESARFYERALAAARRCRPLDRRRAGLLAARLGEAWFRLGEHDRADDALRLAGRYADETVVSLTVALNEVRTRVRTARYVSALRRLTRMERLLEQLPADERDEWVAHIDSQRAFIRHAQGRDAEAVVLARRAVAAARARRALDPLGRAYQVLDLALVRLGQQAEEPYAELALEAWTELGELQLCARAMNHLGIRAYYDGDWPTAVTWYRRGQEAFERSGDAWGASVTAGNLGEILSDQGNAAAAEPLTREALRVARSVGSSSFIALWTAQLGRIALRLGRGDEGLDLLREAQRRYVDDGEAAAALLVEAQIASGLAITGAAAEALAVARTALEQLGHVSGAGESESLLHRARGFALVQLGKPDEAVAAFREALESARRRTGRRDIALSLDALLTHAKADPDQVHQWISERDLLVRRLGIEVLGVAKPSLVLVPQQGGADVLAG
jgi:class 3 adenylate cyclase/tetratricopeptide (TPR) repeat protein